MLQDLKEIQSYYNLQDWIIYEDDLRDRYGHDTVDAAINDGSLEHRWIPCKNGVNKCVCWPSGIIV